MLANDSTDTISLRQILDFLGRHVTLVLLTVLLCVGLAFIAAEYFPQKYKSKAVLSIQSSYFQHPLVSDLLSEVHDPSELSSQRLSLLRLALDDQFLDALVEKYTLYTHPRGSPALKVMDRERFLKKIEYFSVSPTSFQISIIAPDRNTAFSLTKEVLAQMTFTLIEQRYQTLMQAREAILKQAKLLNKTLISEGVSPQQETLQVQLATMEANLAALRTRFTESHPDVVRIKGSSEELRSRIASMPSEPERTGDDYVNVFLSPASRVSTQEIFDDLLKKLSHLNIVLEMERDRQNVSYLAVIEQPTIPTKPFSPDRLLFMLIGALCGFLLSGIRVVFVELQRAAKLSPDQVSAFYDLEFLGELPAFTEREYLLLLEAPRNRVVALPSPNAES